MNQFIERMSEKYGGDISRDIRKYIDIKRKHVKCEEDINFIRTCQANGEPPKFTEFKLADKNLSNNNRLVKGCRWKLTNAYLSNHNNRLRELKKVIKTLETKIFPSLSEEDWIELCGRVDDTIHNTRENKKETHRRNKQFGNTPINIDTKNVTVRRGQAPKDDPGTMDAIFNYSSYELSQIERQVLSKGLKYGIYERKVDTYEILSRFELLAQSFNRLDISQTTDERVASFDPRNTFIQELQRMASEFIKISEQASDNLTSDERAALINLSKNKDIVVTKADKGNAVVIQNKADYMKKVSEILSTQGKFKKLPEDPTIEREKSLQNALRYLWKTRHLDDTILDRITPCGSRSGVLYGLPKVHKKGTPIRPIISAVQTYNYGLAKYLDEILKPIVDKEMMLTDTYDFVNKLAVLNTENDKQMVSFDVESLFTNIPTRETIDIILDITHGPEKVRNEQNRLVQNKKLFHGLLRKDLEKLLTICTQESHFQFNGKFYDQVDGVAMGSPLGPLFANVFMSNFERKHKEKLHELGITHWWRYVDDVFATLKENTEPETILDYLNKQHKNIKFTVEYENDGKLPFLDTCVYRAFDSYRTTIYRKKTFTGVYLKWTSLTTKKYKIGLIYCLLNRAWKICTDEEEREREINKIRAILAKNEYPEQVVEDEIKKFIGNRQRENEQPPQADQQLAATVEKQKRYMVLPYVSQRVEGFTKRLKTHVNKFFPQVDLNVAFRTPNEIGKFFPFKDRVRQITSRALVVYRIKCSRSDCDATYIGKTQRILCHRLKEHQNNESSACKQHEIECAGHTMDYENIEILDQAESNLKLEMKELLHIVQHKPSLNRQLNAQSKFNIRTLIIAAYPRVNEDDTN